MSVPPVASVIPSPIAEGQGYSHDQASRLRAIVAGLPGPVRADAPRIPDPAVARPSRRVAKVIAIASGKGGVGKTSLAVNLSIAFHKAGLRTTLVDADFGTANVDVVCGISPSRRIDLSRRDSGTLPNLSQLAMPTPFGFNLVPGSVGTAGSVELSADQRKRFVTGLDDLDGISDVIVIDTAAGIGPNTRCFMHAADLPIVLLTPDPASIADAYALLKCLAAEGLAQESGISFILNQVGSSEEATLVASRLGAVSRRFLRIDPDLLGSIGWDSHALLASRTRKPVLAGSRKSQSCRDLECIAAMMLTRLHLNGSATLDEAATRTWWGVRRNEERQRNAKAVQ